MTRRARYLLGSILAAPLLAAGAAQAQPVTGLYVGAAGGANLLQDEEVRISPSFPGGKDRWDVGWAGLGSVGYGFGNGVRVELEGDDRGNTLQHFLETPFPTHAGGTQNGYGTMANVLFDMDIGRNWIYPYVGLGVGYQWVHWNLHDTATTLPFAENLGGTTGDFAWQAMLGLSFPVPWVVGLSLTTEYRFLSVVSPLGFTGSSSGAIGAEGAPGPFTARRGNVDINSDYNHSLLLGHLPRVLRLGPLGADAAGPRDRRRGRAQLDDRADDDDRGRRLCRHLARPARRARRPIQPRALAPPRRKRPR